MIKKLALTIMSIGLACQSHAYDAWSEGKILKLRIQSNRILVTQQNATYLDSCPGKAYLTLQQSDNINHKNMYSALLTAYASQKDVQLALTGCDGGYPLITEVWIK